MTYYKQKTIKIQGNKNRLCASRPRTLKDALEARRGGGAEKGPAVDKVRRNKHREDRQNE